MIESTFQDIVFFIEDFYLDTVYKIECFFRRDKVDSTTRKV
jgi:hypothetical protein